MSFPDFAGTPAAHVDVGDGGAHDPQLRVAAQDNGCIWNDFPFAFGLPPSLDCGIARGLSSKQLSSFVTTAGGGTYFPSNAQWPKAAVWNYLSGLLCGWTLQARIQFVATGGGTSVGSVGIFEVGDGACGAQPGPILGYYDSGWFDISCEDCTLAPDYIELVPGFTNFNPTVGVVQIDNGYLDLQWNTTGVPIADFAPNWTPQLFWRPPCWPDPVDPLTEFPAGMWYQLGTDSCGALYETYFDVQARVAALGVPLTLTTLGGHGTDIANVDPSCTPVKSYFNIDFYPCPMAGAICSGGVDTSEGQGGGAN